SSYGGCGWCVLRHAGLCAELFPAVSRQRLGRLRLRLRHPHEGVRDDMGERIDKLRKRVERLGAPEQDPSLARKGLCLDIEVIEDLKMIGHESDRAHKNLLSA